GPSSKLARQKRPTFPVLVNALSGAGCPPFHPLAEGKNLCFRGIMKTCRGVILSGVGITLITVFLVACSSVPLTGRKQLRLVSAGEEAQLGLTSFDQVKKETPISRDPTANAMV